LRIGIDATSLPPAIAGAGRYIFGLIEGLSKGRDAHEFFIYCKNRDGGRFSNLPENFIVRTIPSYRRPRRIFWQIHSVHEIFTRDHLDLWHATHYVVPDGKPEIPVIATIHDLAFFHFPQFSGFSKGHFFRWAIRKALQTSTVLVAVSRSTKNDIIRLFPGSAPCFHIPSGVSELFFQNGLFPQGQQELSYLLAVGTQEKRKNFPFLIRVFSRIAKDYPGLDLVVVGQPENDSENLKSAIAAHGLENRVRLTGYVSNQALLFYYKNAQVFCHPSAYEGFGFPVLEALAAGTPVLASNRPAMTEIGNGFVSFAPFHDERGWEQALRKLLENRPSPQERDRGQRYAGKFSWQETARQMIAVYESAFQYAASSNGKSHAVAPETPAGFASLSEIEKAVLRTAAYADVFDYPLTGEEIYSGLLEYSASRGETKWAIEKLRKSGILSKHGTYFTLPRRGEISRNRQKKESQTRALLQKHGFVLRFIAGFPFVKAVAISGAAAFGNCTQEDDIDLFIMTNPGRLWSVYTILVVILKLLRRRNIFCLNYLVSESAWEKHPRNLYIAHQIAHLRPIYRQALIQQYKQRFPWVKKFLPQGGTPLPVSLQKIASKKNLAVFAEKIFGARLFHPVESVLRYFYGRHISRLTRHLDKHSVEISSQKIMLFTNNHVYSVLEKFHQKIAELDNEIVRSKERRNAKERVL
jgi:glycosyltransferase involved in cell wall biosynthesis